MYIFASQQDDWTDIETKQVGAYFKSKTLSERKAWELAQEHKLDLVVINPVYVVGKVLYNRTPESTALVWRTIDGDPMVPDAQVPIVDVQDVADAHISALTAEGAVGKRFILSNEVWSQLKVAKCLKKHFGQYGYSIPSRTAPNCMIWCMKHFDPGEYSRVLYSRHRLIYAVCGCLLSVVRDMLYPYLGFSGVAVDGTPCVGVLIDSYRSIDDSLVECTESLIGIGKLKDRRKDSGRCC